MVDNTTVKDSTGATVTLKTKDVGAGVQANQSIPTDTSGLPCWGTAGTANANVMTVQGIASGTSLPTSIAKVSTLPAAASDAASVNAMSDKYGRSVVVVTTLRDLVGTQTTTISASTAETTIVTAVASVFCDLVMLIVSNTSTGTNTRIDFRDTTGGSVLFSLQSVGGGAPVGFALPVPIPQTTVNTNWTAQCATSTTDVRVYAVYAKNK